MWTPGESSEDEAIVHIALILERYNLTYTEGQSLDAESMQVVYNDLCKVLTQIF